MGTLARDKAPEADASNVPYCHCCTDGSIDNATSTLALVDLKAIRTTVELHLFMCG